MGEYMGDGEGQDILSLIADLRKQFRDGKLERRQFLSGAVALGLSVAAATVLATNVMAAERAPSPAERGAPSPREEERQVEIRVPRDLGISDEELSRINKDFENKLIGAIQRDSSQDPKARPKTQTIVHTKRQY